MIFDFSMIIQDLLSELNLAPKSLFQQREERQQAINVSENDNFIESILSPDASKNAFLAFPAQASPNTQRRIRSKSKISIRWKKEKIFCEGRYGSIYYASNLSHPEQLIIVKEFSLPIPLLVSAEYDISNIQPYLIVNRINYLTCIQHDNIASYLGVEATTVDRLPFIQVIRTYIEGHSVFQRVQRDGAIMDEFEIGQWIYPILLAVEHLHSNNIVCERIHSQNIIISTQGKIFLTDFGIEKTLLEAHNTKDDNQLLYTKRHDIWDIGALILDILSGGKQHVYGNLDINTVDIPTSISPLLLHFIRLCFDENSKDIGLLLQTPFITSIRDRDEFDVQNNDGGLLYSCEMPKDSSSRYEADFEQIELLGRGGFGEVWRARNRLDGRFYAIKKIPLDYDNIQENRKILREVTTLARLHHEYVVRYYQAWIESNINNTHTKLDDTITSSFGDLLDDDDDDLSELEYCNPDDDYSEEEEEEEFSSKNKKSLEDLDDSSSSGSFGGFESDDSLGIDSGESILYIQMEYCTGTTLSNLLQDGQLRNHSERIWKLFRQILEGLHHIHQQNMIHRDLKPPNIFLDSNNNVKIGDFGLATGAGFDPNNTTQNTSLSIDIGDSEVCK